MNESMTLSMYIKPDYSADIEAWLAQGNQINVINNGASTYNKALNNKPKNAQSAMSKVMAKSVAVQREKIRARQEEDKAHKEDVLAMGKWLDEKKGRAKQLSKLMGHAHGYISQVKMFTRPCSKEKMEVIKQKMKEIERLENITNGDKEQSQ